MTSQRIDINDRNRQHPVDPLTQPAPAPWARTQADEWAKVVEAVWARQDREHDDAEGE